MNKLADDEDSGPTYLSPAWHRARRLAREQPQPPPAPVVQLAPPVPPPHRIPKRPYDPDARKCDAQGCTARAGAWGAVSYCQKHAERRRKLGHESMRKPLTYKAIRHDLVSARKYLRLHPPSPEVLDALSQEVLSPTASFHINFTERFANARTLSRTQVRLRAVMQWWHDPQSAKKGGRGWRRRTHGTDPLEALAVLLAVTVYTDRYNWGSGFAPEMARAMLLLKLRRMRAVTKRHGYKGRLTVTIHGQVRKLLAQVISERVGKLLLVSAREILKQQPAPRTLPKTKPTKPAPAPRAEPRPTRQIKITLPPRYRKPTIGRICTTAELRAWEVNEAMWKRCPEGHYYETKEVTEE